MHLDLATLVALAAALPMATAYPMQVLKNYNVKPYTQEALDQYNTLRFLGTSSPYIQHPGHGIQRDAPYGCSVSQVNMIARHGERYPTASKGASIAKGLERVRNITEDLEGPAAFLTSYEFEALDESLYDSETFKGPYSGLGEMYNFGRMFRQQYDDLVGNTSNLTFYTASQQRVVDSAHKFAEGFLGFTPENASFYVIDEDDATLGANSLTPVTGCTNYDDDANSDLIDSLSDAYLNATTERINAATPGLNLTTKEVGSLFDYCGFALNAGGLADVCEIFTTDELIARSYYNDVTYYYTKGPGYNLSAPIGSIYVNAMIEMMKSDDRNMTLNFAHDTDIFFIVTLLGLFDGDLPVDYMDLNSLWKVSNINPMGSRLVFEKLTCKGDGEGEYVRIVHNDAVLPIAQISTGPGFSALLDDFEGYIQKRLDGVTYSEACGVEDAPTELTFYWD